MFAYGEKTALITGASSGIGYAFAHALASRHMHLILVARSEERLNALATELSNKFSVTTNVIAADLGKENAAQSVEQEVERRGLTIDLLVNNAGFANNGYFETIPAERDHQQVMVDVTTIVDMAHAFIPPMVARGEGAVINVASTAAFQPLPYMAVYGASKAFVLSFSQALYEEYRSRGIRVLALCPGATETPFFETAGDSASVGKRRTPEQVVNTGLRALEQGRSVVIDGASNALTAQMPRLFPRQLVARIAGQMIRPRK